MSLTSDPVPPFKELVKSLMLSNLAYTDQLDQIMKVLGHPEVKFISGSPQGQDSQGYILTEGRIVFVIFRGTDDTKDMIADAQAIHMTPVSFDENIRVHRGFHLQYKAIEAELNTFLDQHQSEYNEIIFTGHSLGGALATIATVYFYHKTRDPQTTERTNDVKIAKCQTYGCPRVGNSSFSEYYEKCFLTNSLHSWRVCNQRDPAPKFPSQTSIMNSDIYVHVKGNTLTLSDTIPTTYTVTQIDNQLNVPWNFASQLSQHHTALYMNRLLQIVDPQSVPRLFHLPPQSQVVDLAGGDEITLSTNEEHEWTDAEESTLLQLVPLNLYNLNGKMVPNWSAITQLMGRDYKSCSMKYQQLTGNNSLFFGDVVVTQTVSTTAVDCSTGVHTIIDLAADSVAAVSEVKVEVEVEIEEVKKTDSTDSGVIVEVPSQQEKRESEPDIPLEVPEKAVEAATGGCVIC